MDEKELLVFSKKQITIWDNDHDVLPRLTILEGAVRSGKTFLNNMLFLEHIKKFSDQNKKFIITGNTLGAIRRNIIDDITYYDPDMKISSQNEFTLFGNSVSCFGGNDSTAHRKIKGFTAYGWYGNEITEQHQQTIQQAMSRCSGEGARIFWDTNPAGPGHYIKTDYIDRSGTRLSTGRPAIQSWHFVLDNNTRLDADYVEMLKKSFPEDSVWHLRNIEGAWVSAGNIIYTHYKVEDLNINNPMEYFDEIIGGIDFGRGGHSPFAFILLGRRGDTYTIFHEISRSQCTNSDFITMVTQSLLSWGEEMEKCFTLYGDSADPDKMVEWKRAGYNIRGADKSANSVMRGIDCVMSHPLVISRRCVGTITEIMGYEWEKGHDGTVLDRPIKFNDHYMDALRYAIYSHTKRAMKYERSKGHGIVHVKKPCV